MPRGNGADHHIRTRHGVAARVELQIRRPGRAALSEIETIPIINGHAAFLWDKRQVGNLTDGGDDRIHVERVFGTFAGNRFLATAAVKLA